MSMVDIGAEKPSSFPSRSQSETAPMHDAPSTPTSPSDKKVRRRRQAADDEKKKQSSKRSASTTDSSVDSYADAPLSAVPSTPRAKQKLRRASLGAVVEDLDKRDGLSVHDTNVAVISPTKTKSKRRSSLGVLDKSKQKARASKEGKKKSRPRSIGPHSRPSSSRSAESENKDGVADLMSHLERSESTKLRDDEDEGSGRSKTRATVDGEGRVRRIKKKSKDDGDDSDGDHTKKSTSSKRSKGSSKNMGSTKSSSSRRIKEKEDERRKKRSGAKKDKFKKDAYASDHSDNSARSGKSARRTARKVSPEQAGTISSLPKFDKRDSDQPPEKLNEPFSSNMSEYSSINIRTDLADINPVKTANLEKEIDALNKRIVELKEEQLKVQFQAQSEAAKLRKESREEKLELQRSQTERRELRAELRERDLIIDESDRKIEALEKAVESQLDKVDDLEDELRRANEEIFSLEEKLSHMEKVLADSAGVEVNGNMREKELDEKRQERLERRLEDREKDLEERERKLREARNEVHDQSQPQREVGQLEQDNRMLLKALNREKTEAADMTKEKDSEIGRLNKDLKEARMRSYSQISSSDSGENAIAKLMKENDELQEKYRMEHAKVSSQVQKKDDAIAFLEMEMKRLKSEIESRDMGDFDGLKRNLEASRAESQAMKSKCEGAQRRNLILEDDIDHWKSVNCNLEDELAEWKSQAANWRSKYEHVVSVDIDDEEGHVEPNILPFALSRGSSRPVTAAELAFSKREDSDEERDGQAQNTISNLWSKLTTPTSKRPTTNQLQLGSLQDVLTRSTFH
jgi:hypothetical protein